jgi:hypothetical protein
LEAIALQSEGYGHNMTGFIIVCVLGGVFLFSIIEMIHDSDQQPIQKSKLGLQCLQRMQLTNGDD